MIFDEHYHIDELAIYLPGFASIESLLAFLMRVCCYIVRFAMSSLIPALSLCLGFFIWPFSHTTIMTESDTSVARTMSRLHACPPERP